MQAGKQLFSKVFGLRENLKLWAYSALRAANESCAGGLQSECSWMCAFCIPTHDGAIVPPPQTVLIASCSPALRSQTEPKRTMSGKVSDRRCLMLARRATGLYYSSPKLLNLEERWGLGSLYSCMYWRAELRRVVRVLAEGPTGQGTGDHHAQCGRRHQHRHGRLPACKPQRRTTTKVPWQLPWQQSMIVVHEDPRLMQ